MNNKKKIEKELRLMVDLFSGGDGAVGYVQLRTFLDVMAERADNGDKAAVDVLDVVYRFNKLIDYAMSNVKM